MVCLTFDIEERFHSHLTPSDSPREWLLQDRIEKIIDFLVEQKKQATFFVVGELAEAYPNTVRRMHNSGFEVASHSHSHLKMDGSNADECMRDISRSKETLETIIGNRIYGYRSPSWSAKLNDEWLWSYLIDLGFVYDASLFPFKTNMYGSFANPVAPFRIRKDLAEIPASVYKLGRIRIPFGGGFYFRLYPSFMTRTLINRSLHKQLNPMLYFHPWEFECSTRVHEKSLFARFVGNFNIRNSWSNFTQLVSGYQTTTVLNIARQVP